MLHSVNSVSHEDTFMDPRSFLRSFTIWTLWQLFTRLKCR